MTTKFPLTVRDHMTASPHTIGARQPLDRAHAMMREHGIRHLPVLDGDGLVGVVSARDLALVEDLPDVDGATLAIEEAMSTDLFTVSPDAPLRVVAEQMADRKLGCAIVVAGNEVVGVFTAVDACRALASALGHLAA
jgi:acetoin utilization protein AcuB